MRGGKGGKRKQLEARACAYGQLPTGRRRRYRVGVWSAFLETGFWNLEKQLYILSARKRRPQTLPFYPAPPRFPPKAQEQPWL